MTWGSKRRARAANILADLGKIIAAAAVIGPLVQAGSVGKMAMMAWLAVVFLFFGAAVWVEKEDHHDGS